MAATNDIECQSYHDDKMEDEDYVLQVLLKENQRQTLTSSFAKTNDNSDKHLDKWLRLVQIFTAKLVLEVFGGAGAVWGFSEVVGLRSASTVWFWKPSALAVGAIFFMRWLSQIQEYIVEENIIFFEGKSSNGVDIDEEKMILTPQNLYS